MSERRPYDWDLDGISNPPYDWVTEEATPEAILPVAPTRREGRRLPNWLTSTAVSLLPIVGGASVALAFAETVKLISGNANASTKQCAAPSPYTMKAVEKLFVAEPADPLAEPSKYGLTLYDGTAADEALKAIDTRSALGMEQLMQKANGYLKPYGVRLSFVGKQEAATEAQHDPVTTLSPRTLTGSNTAAGIINVTEGLMNLPVQGVQFSGVKRVVFYQNNPKNPHNPTNPNIEYQAYVNNPGASPSSGYPDLNTIYWNISSVPDAGDFSSVGHEIWHEDDGKMCGPNAMADDPTYTQGTPPNIYGSKNDDGYANLAKMQNSDSYQDTKIALADAAADGRKQRYCRLWRSMKARLAKVAMATDYSFKDVMEDKAEVGSVLTEPDQIGDYLDSRSPILKHKFEVLMARLYERKPNLVKYFAAISSRPNDKPDFHCG